MKLNSIADSFYSSVFVLFSTPLYYWRDRREIDMGEADLLEFIKKQTADLNRAREMNAFYGGMIVLATFEIVIAALFLLAKYILGF
jgi:hypothetical protein